MEETKQWDDSLVFRSVFHTDKKNTSKVYSTVWYLHINNNYGKIACVMSSMSNFEKFLSFNFWPKEKANILWKRINLNVCLILFIYIKNGCFIFRFKGFKKKKKKTSSIQT